MWWQSRGVLCANPGITAHLKDQLIKERSVKKSLERARNCDIVLQSVGPLDETAILFIHGYLSLTELNSLKEKGAVVTHWLLFRQGRPDSSLFH